METVFTNLAIIWNAPKDWSLGAGPIWLCGFALALVIIAGVGVVTEARAGR